MRLVGARRLWLAALLLALGAAQAERAEPQVAAARGELQARAQLTATAEWAAQAPGTVINEAGGRAASSAKTRRQAGRHSALRAAANKEAAGPGRDNGSRRVQAQLASRSAPPDSDGSRRGSPEQQREAGRSRRQSELSEEEKKLKCRLEKDLYLDLEQYRHYTCTMCYNHVTPIHAKDRQFLIKLQFIKPDKLYHPELKRYVWPNETELIKSTFKADSTYYSWLDCCGQALQCCKDNQIYLPKTRNEKGELIDDVSLQGVSCPATWDGLSCWPNSPAGKMATRECPDHVYFLDFVPICKGQVQKQCFANGSWLVRKDHEWSDFNDCGRIRLYAIRLLIGSVWHFLAAIVIAPALIILDRFPNRAGSKRVRILYNLMFWMLVSSCITMLLKIGILTGHFQQERPHQTHPSEARAHQNHQASLVLATQNSTMVAAYHSNNDSIQHQPHSTLLATTLAPGRRTSREVNVELPAFQANGQQANKLHLPKVGHKPEELAQLSGDSSSGDGVSDIGDSFEQQASHLKGGECDHHNDCSKSSHSRAAPKTDVALNAQHSADRLEEAQVNLDDAQTADAVARSASCSSKRCTRDTHSRLREKGHPLVIVLCWLIEVGSRVSRLFVYSWMFTGGVYLCSVLHFAPAEPPNRFIKVLMLLTNGFPIVTSIIYLILRTVYEDSPLNLLFQLPYYYFKGEDKIMEQLMNTQLVCWLNETKYRFIDEIITFPNLILVLANLGLFLVTLFIMCRITRPGSTRPEMSLSNYFRAAGTLVVLDGAHYSLISWRPDLESFGCFKGQTLYYALLIVEGIQGIAVSYVFCYRTPEGREIMYRWWMNLRERLPRWLCFSTTHTPSNRDFLQASNRSNQSIRSNNSVCNGKDITTELIDINDTPVANRFNP